MRIKVDTDNLREATTLLIEAVDLHLELIQELHDRLKLVQEGVQGINLRVHALEEKSNAIKKG